MLAARGLRALAVTALAVACVAASVAIHVATPAAWTVLARAALGALREVIPGRIELDEVAPARGGAIRFAGVRVFDADGREVIRAPEVLVTPAWAELLVGGRIALDTVRVSRGDVLLRWRDPDRSALPTLVEAFLPAGPSTGGGPGPEVRLPRVELRDTRVHGTVPGAGDIDASGTDLDASITSTDTLRITFANGRSLVRYRDARVAIAGLSGTYGTRDTDGLALALRATVPAAPGDGAEGTVAFRSPAAGAPAELRVTVRRLRLSPQTRAALGLGADGAIQGPITASGSLEGPPSALRLAGDLETDAGRAEVAGTLTGPGAFLELRTDGLALDRLSARAPAVTLAGTARLAWPPDPQAPPTLSAKLQPFDWEGTRVPAVEAEGALLEDGIRIDRAALRSATLNAVVHGQVGFDGRTALSVKAQATDLAREPLLRTIAPSAAGAGTVSAELNLDGGTWTTRLALDLTRFVYGPLRVESGAIEGTARVGPAGITLTAATLRARGVSAYGTTVATLHATARGPLERLQASASLALRGGASVRVAAHASVGPDGLSLAGTTFTLTATGEPWSGSLGRLAVTRAGSVTLDDLTMTRAGSRLTAAGSVTPTGDLQGRVSARGFPLSLVGEGLFGVPAGRLRGQLDATAEASGTVRDPSLHVELALSEGRILHVPLEGAGVIDLEPGVLRARAQTLVTGRGSVTVDGSVALDSTAPSLVDAVLGGLFDVRAEVQGFDAAVLDDALADAGARMSGDAAGEVHVTGPLFAPTLVGALHLPAVSWPSWPSVRVDTTFRYENSYLIARVSTADAQGPLAEVEGALLIDLVQFAANPTEGLSSLESLPWRLAAKVPLRAVQDLPLPLRERLPAVTHGAMAGLVAALEGGATPPRGTLTVDLAWKDGTAVGLCTPTQSAHALITATLADDRTRVHADAFVEGTKIFGANAQLETPVNRWLLDGTVGGVPPMDVELIATRAPLDRVPWVCTHGRGEATMALRLSRLFTPDVAGALEVTSASMRLGKVAPFRVDARLEVTPDEVSGAAQFGWWTSERATAQVSIPFLWAPGAHLPSVDAESAVVALEFAGTPIAPFVGLLPKVDRAAGRVDGVVELRGKPDAIDMSGELRIADGELQLAATGQRLTHIDGAFILHSNWVEVDNIIAHDGAGALRVAGSVGFNGWKPETLKLALHGSSFPVRHEGATLATLTGIAALEGEFQEAADLVLSFRELDIMLPKASDRRTQPLGAHPDIRAGRRDATDTAEAPYVISMLIDANQPFWIRRGDFAVEVGAELMATYASPELLLGGFIEMKSGHFSVYGRPFQIDWGAINFDGSASLDPSVNLSAVHRLRGGGTVTVTVSGTLREPRIAFSSTEATDPGEIVALLVTGRVRGRGNDTREAEQQTADFVAGFLSGFLSLTLQEAFGNYLPQFAVDASSLRAGQKLDFLIPKPLEDVVLGVYFEGQLQQNQDPAATSDSSSTPSNEASTSTQLLLELQFPYSLYFEGLWAPPNRWRLDLLWEP